MKELKDIVEAVARSTRRTGLLATVVAASGSTYRRPGARLLVLDDGTSVGSISGGCLEADVIERGSALAPGASTTVTYDTRSDEDLVWGLGLGCNGVVTILIERVDRHEFEWLEAALASRRTCVFVRVYTAEGTCRDLLGARLVVTDRTSDGEASLRECVEADARSVLETRASRTARYERTGGSFDAFIEAIEPPLHVLVFGAGHDAVSLVRQAALLGWDVTVVDHRRTFATLDRFPEATNILCIRPEQVRESVDIDDRTAIVLMTHNYGHDLALMGEVVPSPAFYVGVLGPRRRTSRMLAALGETSIESPQLDRLWSPVGLDIGADSPEQIALAIVAEVLAVRNRRTSGSLRDRAGAIHGRASIVVLAAGGSTRLGTAKQLLEFRGRSLLRHAVETALAANVGPVVVVLGAEADVLRFELEGLDVEIVVNSEWRAGLGSSIRAGVAQVKSGAADDDPVLLMLCDQPLVTSDVLRQLVDRHRATRAPIVACAYGDTLGVPAIFDARLTDELMRLPAEHGAKDLIASYRADVASIHVPVAVIDVDTADDVTRLHLLEPSFKSAPLTQIRPR